MTAVALWPTIVLEILLSWPLPMTYLSLYYSMYLARL